MYQIRHYLWLVLLTIATGSLLAQEISFTAEAPKAVRAGERFQLTYTLNVNADNFTPPSFGEFRALGSPFTGSSSESNFDGSRWTRSVSYTYTYILQAGNNEGTFTIPPATADYKRNLIQSNSVIISVVSGGQSTTPSQSGGNNEGTSSTRTESTGEDIFIRVEFDKRSAYLGEQITAWIKIYTKQRIGGISEFKAPDFSGFYQQEIQVNPTLEPEKVGNEVYQSAILKKVVLTPQKAGKINIDPVVAAVIVQKIRNRRSFFDSPFQDVKIALRSNSAVLDIKELPAGQPANFNGVVGNFRIDASVSQTELAANDAVTFRVNVTGTGNIKLIDKVNTGFPTAFDVFDPVKKIQVDEAGKSGNISFEYTVIPRHVGNFSVSPFSLVYFDPVSGSYKTISTRPFDIRVIKGKTDSTTFVVGNLSKEQVELLGSDIRYIETRSRLIPLNSFIYGSGWFFLFYIAVILVSGALLFIRREQIKQSANIVRYRNRKAGKVASKRLKLAYKLLRANDKAGFYEELEQALWRFVSDKLNITLSELSGDRVKEEFIQMKISEELSSRFFDIVNTCQMARYAPGGSGAKMTELYHASGDIINKLDQNL